MTEIAPGLGALHQVVVVTGRGARLRGGLTVALLSGMVGTGQEGLLKGDHTGTAARVITGHRGLVGGGGGIWCPRWGPLLKCLVNVDGAGVV